MRSSLWERVPSSRPFLITAELAEVRAVMSLAAMTPDRYITEAFLHGMLPGALEAVLGNHDLELSDWSCPSTRRAPLS
ncbi:hypothetical protein QLQ12_00895 [Actinoplanes sp. NEAU-A12]|uniref:Uncharacterized protein n=1 Tax=Actinoplanes sandaracinus TaxID=3045177 RepID=A0ABT6WBR5_9ACTN|nr:hypothetical protein [Actinoplanes sandaracinus]MDI6097165.1 hypothetical protein [Actinoplanes sandaracinus]